VFRVHAGRLESALLILFGLACASVALNAAAHAGNEVATGAEVSSTPEVRNVIARIDAGDFAGAEAAIAKALPGANLNDARVLAFQRERMHRIRLDFEQDAAAVQARVRKEIPDL
jgi:hypothetical protein